MAKTTYRWKVRALVVNKEVLFLKIEQEMTSGRSFKIGENIRLRSINWQLRPWPTVPLRHISRIAKK